MTQVAVQEGLTPVVEALQAAGYRVVPLGRASLDQVGAVVLSGMDENLLGDQRTHTPVPVVDARSLTPEEIVAQVGRIGQQG